MGFKCGIVGLPNVGKSTIFNALTAAGAEAANYPFCTIEPNVGIIQVPEERLTELAALFHPEKVTPTTIEFVDIAGLVKGASQGEGLGNQFLGHIREVDAIAHVVRCFEDPDVVHVSGKIDPKSDIEVIETELILSDLEAIRKRVEKLQRQVKAGDKKTQQALSLYERVQEALNQGQPARALAFTTEEAGLLQEACLITAKPVLYVANVSERELKGNEAVQQVRAIASSQGNQVVVISGKVEAEVAELAPEERVGFLRELGLEEAGLAQLARAGYKLLDLCTFFTAGPQEVRAWTIRHGTKAPQAAGVIHTDFEKGFIRAECYSFAILKQLGSEQKVKEAGKLRLEGKDYVIQDGDVLFFRFNV